MRALIGPALNLLGLIAFVLLVGRGSLGGLGLLTAAAALVGLVSLAMGISAVRGLRHPRSSLTLRALAIGSLALSLGYEIVMLILLLDVFVYWLRFS